jgi:hypothetical protein
MIRNIQIKNDELYIKNTLFLLEEDIHNYDISAHIRISHKFANIIRN